VASGSLYSKLHAGSSKTAIRFHGAQAAGCAPVAEAFLAGERQVRPVKAQSRAQSLAIGNPADGDNAISVALSSGGQIVSVPEQDLPAGVSLLGRSSGLLTESAGAVTTMAAEQLYQQGAFDRHSKIVLVITGDGLKGLDLVEDAASCKNMLEACPQAVLELVGS
jgi:threonine synthase